VSKFVQKRASRQFPVAARVNRIFWVGARFCAFFVVFCFFLFVCALSSYRSTMRKVAVLSFACAFLAVLSVAFAQSAPTKFTHYVRTSAGLVTILRGASSPQSRPP
jgi:succinate-acetate transporter protein